MSYGVSAALQQAVYQQLSNDASITALVGSAVYDTIPSGTLPDTYVSLGPEVVRDRSDKTGSGANHIFEVSVVTTIAGFATAKSVGAAISDALHRADMALSRGTLVGLVFVRADAKRIGSGDTRRIDLKFRARVDDS
ncbi:DUF3168 domain-containing protein [Algirhabdus cladophorae]|uniref:DUF3168 domain-containing protein n=1 Tax=Algirhabdus cladophorae TaxID=3377108 RepID=UPI003B8481F8